MPKMTVSLVKGEGALKHNNRNYTDENRPEHIDADRANLNYTIKNQSIEEAYKDLFADAIKDYDDHQNRQDRKIGTAKNYLEKVERSKQQEPFYEIIMQFGDMFSNGIMLDENGQINIEAAEARDMLLEAFNRFEKQYPNLYFFNVTLHMDEATPHIHADYIPFADGYKKGLNRRVAMNKSLEQMGYKADEKHRTPLEKWQENAREIMANVARERGYEIIHTEGKTLHKSVEAYKRDVTKLQKEIERDSAPIPRQKVPFQPDKVIVKEEDLSRLEARANIGDEIRNKLSSISIMWRELERECRSFLEKAKGLARVRERAEAVLASDPVQSLKRQVADLTVSLQKEKQKVADLIADRKANYTPNSSVEAKIKRAKEEANKGMVNQAIYDVIKEKEKEEACKEADIRGYKEAWHEAEGFMCKIGLNRNKAVRDAFYEQFGWDLPEAPEAPTHYR